MENNKITQEEYDALFEKDKKEALKQACEIRKFEIELYWKRATYFWTFIGATFVGYAAFFNSSTPIYSGSNKELILILIACLGLVFSVAWHCVNKGSKFWQENWENHVELLEDQVIGPLYKTLTKRPIGHRSKFETFGDFFSEPKPYSVSKINQLISTYMAFIWALILFSSIGDISFNYPVDLRKLILIISAIFTCALFFLVGKSHEGAHMPDVYLRKAKINT